MDILLDKVERLRRKYPAGDPLEVLYLWSNDVREKVVKALKPYVAIESWTGEIRWLVDMPKEGKSKRADDIRLLALATAWEVTGHQHKFALTQRQAEHLADTVWRAETAGE